MPLTPSSASPPAYTTLAAPVPRLPALRTTLRKVAKAVESATKVEWDSSLQGKGKAKMTQPPRMLLLDGGATGGEAFVALPTTYDVSWLIVPYASCHDDTLCMALTANTDGRKPSKQRPRSSASRKTRTSSGSRATPRTCRTSAATQARQRSSCETAWIMPQYRTSQLTAEPTTTRTTMLARGSTSRSSMCGYTRKMCVSSLRQARRDW